MAVIVGDREGGIGDCSHERRRGGAIQSGIEQGDGKLFIGANKTGVDEWNGDNSWRNINAIPIQSVVGADVIHPVEGGAVGGGILHGEAAQTAGHTVDNKCQGTRADRAVEVGGA